MQYLPYNSALKLTWPGMSIRNWLALIHLLRGCRSDERSQCNSTYSSSTHSLFTAKRHESPNNITKWEELQKDLPRGIRTAPTHAKQTPHRRSPSIIRQDRSFSGTHYGLPRCVWVCVRLKYCWTDDISSVLMNYPILHTKKNITHHPWKSYYDVRYRGFYNNRNLKMKAKTGEKILCFKSTRCDTLVFVANLL